MDFAFPTYVEEIALLDTEEGSTVVVTKASGDVNTMNVPGLGDNGFQTVEIDQDDVVQIVVTPAGSGAIPYVVIEHQCPTCPDIREIDFDEFNAGDFVGAVANGLITVSVDASQCSDEAMIFDTANPTGDDYDLGAPNNNCGGPGVGAGGMPGKGGENCQVLGKALIISEDCDPTDPDDNAHGGTITLDFAVPTFVYEIGLIDQEAITTFLVTKSSGDVVTVKGLELGNNSFQRVTIELSDVVKIDAILAESGAIPYLIIEDCPHRLL